MTNPCAASSAAGLTTSCHGSLPNFLCASAMPRTVPGTPGARYPAAVSERLMLPSAPRYIVGVDSAGRRLTVIEGGGGAVRQPHDHEAAAADVAGGRMRHGHGECRRDRGVHGVAAPREHGGTQVGRDIRGRHHEAGPRGDAQVDLNGLGRLNDRREQHHEQGGD